MTKKPKGNTQRYSMDAAADRLTELFEMLQAANKRLQDAIVEVDPFSDAVEAAMKQSNTIQSTLESQSDTLALALNSMDQTLKALRNVSATQSEILHILGNIITIALGWRYLGAAQGLDIELDRPEGEGE